MTNSRRHPLKGGHPARQRRIDRAVQRGEHTPPGTKPNAMNPEKVARKRRARP